MVIKKKRKEDKNWMCTYLGENNLFKEMCSNSEASSCLRIIDFVYHSMLGLRVIKKEKEMSGSELKIRPVDWESKPDEIGISWLNNQLLHRTLHIQKDVLPHAMW